MGSIREDWREGGSEGGEGTGRILSPAVLTWSRAPGCSPRSGLSSISAGAFSPDPTWPQRQAFVALGYGVIPSAFPKPCPYPRK